MKFEDILNVALLTPMGNPHKDTCKWGAPILFWGPPGIGKSGRIEQAGERIGLPVETLYLSGHQPEDLSGVPMSDGKGGAVNTCTLAEIHTLTALGKGILFLDELSTARPATQNAGLAVVYERKIAGKRLPGRVRVVGAANPPEDTAGGWNLNLPMANRLLHVDAPIPSREEWINYILSSDVGDDMTVEEGEETIRMRWANSWPKLKGLVTGFMRVSEDETLYKIPAAGHKNRGRAWPSHRSWEAAARCMAAADALEISDSLAILEACVGSGCTAKWATWVAEANLPDPKSVLDEGWRADKRRLDIAFAVLHSAIGFALAQQDKKMQRDYVVKSWTLLEHMVSDSLTDIALGPGKLLLRAGFGTKAGGDIERASRPVLSHFGRTDQAKYVPRA